jgi:hypothetical protein
MRLNRRSLFGALVVAVVTHLAVCTSEFASRDDATRADRDRPPTAGETAPGTSPAEAPNAGPAIAGPAMASDGSAQTAGGCSTLTAEVEDSSEIVLTTLA